MRLFKVLILISVLSSCSCECESNYSGGFSEGTLVHTVVLKLKPNTSETRANELLEKVKTLEQISETMHLFVAEPAETNDPRAAEDYDIILQMGFASIEDLKTYSKNDFHLSIREELKSDLARAPIVYDYWVR